MASPSHSMAGLSSTTGSEPQASDPETGHVPAARRPEPPLSWFEIILIGFMVVTASVASVLYFVFIKADKPPRGFEFDAAGTVHYVILAVYYLTAPIAVYARHSRYNGHGPNPFCEYLPYCTIAATTVSFAKIFGWESNDILSWFPFTSLFGMLVNITLKALHKHDRMRLLPILQCFGECDMEGDQLEPEEDRDRVDAPTETNGQGVASQHSGGARVGTAGRIPRPPEDGFELNELRH